MKTIKVYEFKDLVKGIQKKIIEKTTNNAIEVEIEVLSGQFSRGLLGKKEYYNTLWFVPVCYYEKHKKEIDKDVKEVVGKELYTITGQYIQQK